MPNLRYPAKKEKHSFTGNVDHPIHTHTADSEGSSSDALNNGSFSTAWFKGLMALMNCCFHRQGGAEFYDLWCGYTQFNNHSIIMIIIVMAMIINNV